MGKSPGKWIKTVLFGRKSSRSGPSKGRQSFGSTNAKEVWISGKAPLNESVVDSPVISQPVLAEADKNGGNSEIENGVPLNTTTTGITMHVSQEADYHGAMQSDASGDSMKFKEEQAATKAQAAFRGFLARRAFRALKGIIRLQALIRGHLVRRQAVATLHSLQGIIKLQALVRGQRVRCSDVGIEIQKICHQVEHLDEKPLDSVGANPTFHMEKLMSNAFVKKLLVLLPVAMPLRIQYDRSEPNSAWKWLERWSSALSWEIQSQSKKNPMKPQTKQSSSQAAESESSRPKRSVRRNPSANTDSIHLTSDFDKPKRNVRKVTGHSADSTQEHPQSELEKVKRSLRKVSTSTIEGSERAEAETEKPKRALRKVSTSPSEGPDQVAVDLTEKVKKDMPVAVENEPEMETTSKAVETSLKPVEVSLKQVETDVATVDMPHDENPAVEMHTLDTSVKDANVSPVNGVADSKEDQTVQENQKTNKRRASFPSKSEYSENGLPSTPTLPSYMATTESAKAKLRAQGSPRFGQDGAEKNGFTRRHSLPSTNGKVSSPSTRAHRLVQASGKGAIRSDRSLSSREGNGDYLSAAASFFSFTLY
ncbi:iq-domain [Asimina triloba]